MNETQEYLEIMAGRKRLNLEYKTGEFVSGYTAEGLHARIIESLHCGQYIDGWGFLVDREFEDGDIHRMKRHYYEWKEMDEIQKRLEEASDQKEEEKKEAFLDGVQWKKEEKYNLYGGIIYLHSIQLDKKEYVFEEKKISGMGRVIVPQYDINQEGMFDALAECVEGKWYWSYIYGGKEEKVPMDPEEEKAYLIVYRYGCLV